MATTRLPNYYEVLSVDRSATEEEIKQRIQEETRIWTKRTNAPHLDKRQEAELRVRLIGEAHEILLDAAKRATYNEELSRQPAQQSPEEAAARTSGDADQMVAEAKQRLAAGQVPSALGIAREATHANPNHAEAWATLADAKFQFGQVDDAVYEYRKAIDLSPGEGSYYFGLGSVLEAKQDWAAAHAEYKRAQACAPEETIFKVAAASAEIQLGNYASAEKTLSEAVASEPSNPVHNYYLAVCLNDATVNSWTAAQSMMIITDAETAETSRQRLEYALGLPFEDDQLRELIQKNLRAVQLAQETSWQRSVGSTLKVGLVSLLALIIALSASPVLLLIVVPLVGFWIYNGIKPGWKVSREALGMG